MIYIFNQGGGVNAFTVTFMYGLDVWGVDHVKAGESAICPNGNPTKPEDTDYTYSFEGWASTDGKEAGEPGILDNIQSDKTVYAAYSKKAKGFTVTWKNNDGTILATTMVKQGETPTYSGKTPAFVDKENRSAITALGLSHTGWIPEPSPIETDTTYIANYSFPTGMSETVPKTWDEIINDANTGQNTDYELLSTKIMQTTDGNLLCFELAGKDIDTLTEGGTASMTWISRTIDGTCQWNTSDDNTGGYPASNYKKYLESTCLNHIPSNIKSAMKSVTKTYRMGKRDSGATKSASYTIWPPSILEMNWTNTSSYNETSGVTYTAYTSNSQRKRYDSSGTASTAWLRSAYYSGAMHAMRIDTPGDWYSYGCSGSYGALPCFCLGKTK